MRREWYVFAMFEFKNMLQLKRKLWKIEELHYKNIQITITFDEIDEDN